MNKAVRRLIWTAALAATLSTGAVLAQPHSGTPHVAMTTVPTDLSTLQGEAFDIAFMTQMIAHHREAVAMADELLRKYPDGTAREAAETIRVAQEPEIAQMTAWLASWYGVKPVPGGMTGMDAMNAMAVAAEASSDPDATFLRAMIEHHLGAIDMAGLALVRATRGEIRAMARDIVVVQANEIFEYQEWLAER